MPWSVVSSVTLILTALGYSVTEMLRVLEGGMPNPWSLFVFLAGLFIGTTALSSCVWLFFWARAPRGDLTLLALVTGLFFGGAIAMDFVALAKGMGEVVTCYRIPFMYQTATTMANMNFIFYWLLMLSLVFRSVTGIVYFFRYSPLSGVYRQMIVGK